MSSRAREGHRTRHRHQCEPKQQWQHHQQQEQPIQNRNNHTIKNGSTSPTPISPSQSPPLGRRPRTPVGYGNHNSNANNIKSSNTNYHNRPPLVSPFGAPPQSWEEPTSTLSQQQYQQHQISQQQQEQEPHYQHHRHSYQSSSDRSVSSEVGMRSIPSRRHVYPSQQDFSSNRSVVSDTYLLGSGGVANIVGPEEIPMDERSADLQSLQSGAGQQHQHSGGGGKPVSPMRPTSVELKPRSFNGSSSLHNHANHASAFHQQQHHQNSGGVDDDVSSLGGVEESNAAAMAAALRSQTKTALRGLSPDERLLWDTVQSLLQGANAAVDAAKKEAAVVVHRNKESNNDSNLSEELAQIKEKLAQQQQEQDGALRAIQRVLADVSQERDQALVKLSQMESEEKKMPDAFDDGRKLLQQLQAKEQELAELHESLNDLNAAKDTADEELEEQKKVIAKLNQLLQFKRMKDETTTDGAEKGNGDKTAVDNNNEDLQKQLEDKTSALENAKMIITSLENASGSLANDNRQKIKTKDQEIAALKSALQDYKKKLDMLATELKAAQRRLAISEDSKKQQRRQAMEIAETLESSLTDMREASLILETTHDPASIQNLDELFADCSEALKLSLDAFECYGNERHRPDDNGNGDDSDTDSEQHTIATTASGRIQRQQQKLDTENKTLQEELKKVKEEALHFRLEAERIEKKRDSDVQTLYAEIQLLRVECTTNMDVLAKKERELVVLRDSLKLEDDVGYISDDATEENEEDDAVVSTDGAQQPPTTCVTRKGEYGPSQAEALATLLAHGNGNRTLAPAITDSSPLESNTSNSTALKGELAQARIEKERVLKELKTEKESLANAKMIISSLEKANKSMMEDLRSRLHDSNTAIASLLEKSMESEKTTAKLQAELEALRQEKAKNEDAILIGTSSATACRLTETID